MYTQYIWEKPIKSFVTSLRSTKVLEYQILNRGSGEIILNIIFPARVDALYVRKIYVYSFNLWNRLHILDVIYILYIYFFFFWIQNFEIDTKQMSMYKIYYSIMQLFWLRIVVHGEWTTDSLSWIGFQKEKKIDTTGPHCLFVSREDTVYESVVAVIVPRGIARMAHILFLYIPNVRDSLNIYKCFFPTRNCTIYNFILVSTILTRKKRRSDTKEIAERFR